jgi:hypothetical protein
VVVAVSSTADARRGAPAQPALLADESTSTRVRPWAAPLRRPATKVLLAGGLTLAGWLLGAALSGSTASAADRPACSDAPVVSTVDPATVDHSAKLLPHGKHHKSRAVTSEKAGTCEKTGTGGSTEPAGTSPADETQQADETQTAPETTTTETTKAETTKDSQNTEEPATTKAASSGNLLGGLVGGVLNAVGGTLNTVTTTVGGTLNAVTSTVGAVTDTLSHTVLAPITQPPANQPGAPALLPLDDLLGPVLGGGSNSGGVIATLPGLSAVVTQVVPVTETVAAPVAAPAAAAPQQQQQQGPRVTVAHLAVQQQSLPAVQEQPRDSGVHARNGGGDSTPGLPGGTSAPSAPATSATPGHDGSGGARQQFAVHTDDVTTTQLKLIGASRDHDVDGAGREAALPTTSPD